MTDHRLFKHEPFYSRVPPAPSWETEYTRQYRWKFTIPAHKTDASTEPAKENKQTEQTISSIESAVQTDTKLISPKTVIYRESAVQTIYSNEDYGPKPKPKQKEEIKQTPAVPAEAKEEFRTAEDLQPAAAAGLPSKKKPFADYGSGNDDHRSFSTYATPQRKVHTADYDQVHKKILQQRRRTELLKQYIEAQHKEDRAFGLLPESEYKQEFKWAGKLKPSNTTEKPARIASKRNHFIPSQTKQVPMEQKKQARFTWVDNLSRKEYRPRTEPQQVAFTQT